MTWQDIIQECNKGIEQLHIFMQENPENAGLYDEKLAILECFKQAAIKQQNASIQLALDKVAEDFYDRTGDRISLVVDHPSDSSHLDSPEQETGTDTWIR